MVFRLGKISGNIKNPSFEDGLSDWQTRMVAPAPHEVGNSPFHLIEVVQQNATHGLNALHVVTEKEETGSQLMMNVKAQVWQDNIDLTGVEVLYVDVFGNINANLKEGGIQVRAIDLDSGQTVVWERMNRWQGYNQPPQHDIAGDFDETIALDVSTLGSSCQFMIEQDVWDHSDAGDRIELWVDNIRTDGAPPPPPPPPTKLNILPLLAIGAGIVVAIILGR